MRAVQNSIGLYEFDVDVIGSKGERKTLKGLVDTGSSDCAATYKIITTLKTRPIAVEKVSTVGDGVKDVLVYSVQIGFDGEDDIFPVLRVNSLPDGIHFILGMSVLSRCSISLNHNEMEINWSK